MIISKLLIVYPFHFSLIMTMINFLKIFPFAENLYELGKAVMATEQEQCEQSLR